jgi:hypothetical protein
MWRTRFISRQYKLFEKSAFYLFDKSTFLRFTFLSLTYLCRSVNGCRPNTFQIVIGENMENESPDLWLHYTTVESDKQIDTLIKVLYQKEVKNKLYVCL